MSEPKIGYHSVLTVTGLSASAENTGFPATALANGLTYDRWRAPVAGDSSGNTYLYIDAGSSVPCDYVGIASHNLGTILAQITIYGNTVAGLTGSPTLVAVVSQVGSDAPFMESFTTATFQYWTVVVSPGTISESDYIDIGVLYLGAALTFERCIMGSYAPMPYNRKTEFTTNESENGQFLGRSIVRRGFASSVSFSMMTGAWVRSTFQPFVKHARKSPYFWQWNPVLYPSEVSFCNTENDIGAAYTGDRDRMSANWTMVGLGWDD